MRQNTKAACCGDILRYAHRVACVQFFPLSFQMFPSIRTHGSCAASWLHVRTTAESFSSIGVDPHSGGQSGCWGGRRQWGLYVGSRPLCLGSGGPCDRLSFRSCLACSAFDPLRKGSQCLNAPFMPCRCPCALTSDTAELWRSADSPSFVGQLVRGQQEPFPRSGTGRCLPCL